ncbi:MAG TPA: N-acetylmuramoyl-L-alanine amidase [Hungateiclostridium thermocellum]|uniref:Cell wall hydrolase/autolysin n=2 Tax=Acetivibrio thermocellus TaxID=1515 RepID=A3DE69_ACET2|nr:N-acetylmuramoyl-L-alanine amidase [Acetivibrio thermocellus]ABN52248.1 cell wall hydrolase/autolysin [Acetivibrio thermocellus ATCC 27405]ADU74262.1 cell wall hydrolase/autolysin [Acetivibrio thermocellus DSM 1313]ALX08204.1 cell wall hydrolase/autolysin [Acetivibrio thermocellus AD2]ANV75952.1 cell wall hydrolase/autolysin [Acetivibrio thermocellus DSM 2360]EIC05956.1 cell wall hydrolase/autolysin [Acetivibrio thermocellus YS]
MKKPVILLTVLILVILMTVPGFAANGQYYSGYWGVTSNALIAVNGKVLTLERNPVIIEGRILVPARTTFQVLGVTTEWYSSSGVVKMVKGNKAVKMTVGSKVAHSGGSVKYMEAPPILVNGTVMVPMRFVAETFGENVGWDAKNEMAYIGNKPAEIPSRSGLKSNRTYKVVIDAGHGGSQSGAVYGGVKEKDLNLDIAKRLNTLLKAEGIKTYMTREKDITVGLYTRSDLANKEKADLFVSIHNNAGNSKTSGSMTLYHPDSGKKKGNLTAYEFAQIVQKNLNKTLGSKNMGVIQRPNLAVLRTTNMPAVIAEIGYMSNSAELAKLKTDSYRQKAAEALRDAVIESLEKMYK